MRLRPLLQLLPRGQLNNNLGFALLELVDFETILKELHILEQLDHHIGGILHLVVASPVEQTLKGNLHDPQTTCELGSGFQQTHGLISTFPIVHTLLRNAGSVLGAADLQMCEGSSRLFEDGVTFENPEDLPAVDL
jgi:hypothetical protein